MTKRAKKKFKIRNIVDNLKMSSNRYFPASTLKGAVSPNLPSISIVPLKNITDKELKNAALRAATNKSSHYMSLG